MTRPILDGGRSILPAHCDYRLHGVASGGRFSIRLWVVGENFVLGKLSGSPSSHRLAMGCFTLWWANPADRIW